MTAMIMEKNSTNSDSDIVVGRALTIDQITF